MRTRSALLLAATVGFASACGSFGEGATPAPIGVEPDAGNGGTDGGGPGPGPDAANAIPRPCAARPGVLLCEDFEPADVLQNWTVTSEGGGVAEVVAAPARGGKALSTRLPASTVSNNAQINRNVSWPLPLHVRFFVYLDEPLDDPDYHFLFVLSGNEIGIGNGRLVVVQFQEPDIYESSAETLPVKKWTCVEWLIEPNATKLSFDGAEQVAVSGTSMIPASAVHIGLGIPGPSEVERTILLDDIVVSSSPVGCD